MAEITDNLTACLWLFCTLLAILGCGYALFAAVQFRRFFGAQPDVAKAEPPVTLLKPLCGAEPGLEANIASFVNQSYAGAIETVLAVNDAADPAVDVARSLAKRFPGIEVVIDPELHGENRKISNVMNAMKVAHHDILILSDSDMRVPATYLGAVVGALEKPGAGAVTCFYRGLPVDGLWAKLSAAAIDQHFLPNVIAGLRLGLAAPCFGSTIAMRRETLARIGGFQAFRDQLADDYAVGFAVRRLGLTVEIPPLVLDHVCCEKSFRELVRHELRWARTIRSVDPWGYAGSVVTHPLPFALIAAALQGFPATSLGLVGLALASRLSIPVEIGRTLGERRVPLWLTPLRDLLSFAVFLASFLRGPVTWRGQRFDLRPDGTLTGH